MPKVSVIIPVYNAEKYIQTTIDSILAQSLSDWELLLVDDCSKDNSPAICKEASQNDNRIVYIRQDKNGGSATARNAGISLAKGEFIAFVDSDDTVDSIFLEKMMATAIEHNADIVWCNYKEISGSEVIYRKHNLPCRTSIPYETYIRMYFNNQEGLGSMCNKMYRRCFLGLNNISVNPERVHGEDWEFNLDCFKCHPILVAIDDSLYNYIRQNSSSVVSSYRALDYQTFVSTRKVLDKLSIEEGIEYDAIAMNGRFFYRVIALLVSLKRSKVIDKKAEFKRIVSDDYFCNSIKSDSRIVKYLPMRYKLYFFLIKYRLIKLAYFVM